MPEPQPELSVAALDYDRDGACAVLSLAGRAGITDCRWLRLLLELQAARGQRRLVVDLSRLSSMDWWAALMLSWAGRVIGRRGGVLILHSPQPGVARMLDAVGASRRLSAVDGGRQAGDNAAAYPPLPRGDCWQPLTWDNVRP